MKLLILILLISSVGYSQCKFQKTTTFEKILYTELAVVGYGVADYILYNSFKNWNVEHYRFIQGVIFTGINYVLARYVNPKSALGFSLQVLTAVPDGVYYTIDGISGGFNGFSNGNEWRGTNNYPHLSFMPTVWGAKNIQKTDVITNMILGTAISITIQF